MRTLLHSAWRATFSGLSASSSCQLCFMTPVTSVMHSTIISLFVFFFLIFFILFFFNFRIVLCFFKKPELSEIPRRERTVIECGRELRLSQFRPAACGREEDATPELGACGLFRQWTVNSSWKTSWGPGVARQILLQFRESLNCHWKEVWGNDSSARTQWEGGVIYEPFNLIVDIYTPAGVVTLDSL